MCFESIQFSPQHCLCCASSDKLSHLQSINMESLNALCVLFSMVYGPPLFSSLFLSLTRSRTLGSCITCEPRFEPSAGFFMTTVGEICWSHLQWASVNPFVTLGKKTLNQSVESAQCVCLTSPCSCHQWPGAGRHVSLPYPPVSYHSFICPQGMAALPKTTTHACSRRALFYSSQHPQRKSDIPNCSPKAVVLFMVASQSCFSTLTFKHISTIMIIYIKQRLKKWIYL